MIVLQFGDDLSMIIHLMLIGRIALYKGELARPTNPLLRLRFEQDQNLEVRFVAARSLALLPSDEVDKYPPIAKHGPDALAITHAEFLDAIKRARGGVKSVFMEQELIAGVGSAYADEILYEARIHPLTPVAELSEEQIRTLHGAIANVLQRAIDLGAAEEYVLYLGREAGLTSKHDLMRVHNREGEPAPVAVAPWKGSWRPRYVLLSALPGAVGPRRVRKCRFQVPT
jgi:formamidopyrimidine-DNA glycosylase